ncbi:hypothetical protein VOLCADRAFT_80939 [Volvox carteri f. nagariensis]|uniref:AB hydrolase-1 domain-containing protein n=1 Tax=Volvox carteri f. nagariensis TaxID=3068 RepID=D8TUM8_VOLCA|nr:uncharacterized protein VOLCADRAFT_80939 [Volvox carteri f. nagariensis]EFJ48735.1 hypothetical protein VOLCADRAFT_80939 [Volvox carteri f. nagariensis]|eukprot:XP_002950067.1 hypothetical protein VOLCADRAFT_80939 [Volvox carteri f. nagariensis]
MNYGASTCFRSRPRALVLKEKAPSYVLHHAQRPVQHIAHAQPAAFIPPQINEIVEPAAQTMAANMRRLPVTIPTMPRSPEVATAFVGPTIEEASRYPKDAPTIILLHGFDSSCMEWRRLYPLLAAAAPTYALDLVGWGFTDCSLFQSDPSLVIRPEDKTAHLRAFLEAHTDRERPVVLVGASLGGAKALDFAHTYPQLVRGVVLIDGQGFIDGIGRMSSAPRWLLWLGVRVLQSVPLRQAANKASRWMAYFDKERFATEDAMRIGRLHTHLPGWLDANIAFMRSGGYAISSKISQIQQDVLVLWGRNDEILDPSYASRFQDTLPHSRLVWVEQCGHCAHLEQPQLAAKYILDFVKGLALSTAVPDPTTALSSAIAGGSGAVSS